MSDNTQAKSLDSWVDNHEFLENPLDVYESYTYNIEWFVVDIDADQKFQEFGETMNVESIVNDGWPGVEDTKITIAKTGVTTEFIISDLTVVGSGAGIAETSKLAGTALTLDFTVTEVGTTNLADNLQNAVALCGWKNISETHFYMKINFLGANSKGVKVKIPQTKIITFKITSFTELQTQTDARGTTTLLQGGILQDSVIGDRISLSNTETEFTYTVGETLTDTLGITEKGEDASEIPPKEKSFMDELNRSISHTHPNLLPELQNSYKITMSDQFKEKFGNASTRGITSSTIINMDTFEEARRVGKVKSLMNIYNIIQDICLNAIEIKKELTDGKKGQSKPFKITPWCIPKKNGWNSVTGTRAYNVEFFIDYEKKLIVQNSMDAIVKAANMTTTIDELFAENHINKIYHYLFTGKNDQILDFNITLDQHLNKIYSAPSDWYAYENIQKLGTVEGNKLLEGFKSNWENSAKEEKELMKLEKDLQKELAEEQQKLKAHKTISRKELADAYIQSIKVPGVKYYKGYTGRHKTEALKERQKEFFKKFKTEEELMAALSKIEGVGDLILTSTKNREKLEKSVKKAQETLNDKSNEVTAQKKVALNMYQDMYASAANVSGEYAWKNGVKQNAQKLLSGIKNENPKNMTLLEELDDDIISKMSKEDFESILKSQANNPVVYKRLLTNLSKNKGVVTFKPTDVENVNLARAKYYESKEGHASMINASITIKGDPHWIDGYMPPAVAKKEFGNVGAISDKGYSMLTTSNGYNYIIVKSGAAHGTDLHGNILKRNLITHLYTVTQVTSEFSGGIFTQRLTLNRITDADNLSSSIKEVGPVEENDDKNTFSGLSGLSGLEGLNIDWKPELDSGLDSLNEIPPDKKVFDNVNKLIKGQKNSEELGDYNAKMYNAMKSYGQRTGIGQEPITTAPKNWINENTAQYVDEQAETTDQTVTVQTDIINPPLNGNAAIRNVLANQTLDQLPLLHKTCESQQKNLVMPFTACDTVKDSNKKMLESFGLTIEDQGKASTVTAMNTQINDWIAQGATFSDEEIAVYQIAAGGELNITGHDPDDVQKLVKKATFERTPEIILEEQILGMPSEIVSGSHQNHAIANNGILGGSKPLNDFVVEDTSINTTIIEPYQNADGSIKTDEDFEAEYEAIQADTTCVGACRTTKILKLTNVQNDAWIAQAKLDKIKDQKVKEIVDKSCPAGTESKMNIKKRKFECAPILPGKLTDSEMNDVEVLKDKVIKTLDENYYSESGIANEMAWKANAVELIEDELKDKDLIISDNDKNQLKLDVANKINNTVALTELSDDDYRKIQGYENGINTVIATAQDGHRADLTTAVNVGITEDELIELSESKAATEGKLNQYFWDINGKRVFADELENIEVEIAEKMLYLPDENMTAVATIIDGTTKTYVPIFNPTKQVVVSDQPLIIKNTDEQFDVVLAGGDSTYAGVTTQNNIDQLTQARNLYYQLTSTDSGDMTTVEDDWGVDINVKDFSNISPITYVDANGVTQTINNPSTEFGLYTIDENNMYPANKQDYKAIRQQIADLFPNVNVISGETMAAYLSTSKNGKGMVILNGTAFYIEP